MPNSPEPDEVASPCIGICRINGTQVEGETVCVGCYRSVGEIAAWTSAEDGQRIEFNRNALRRRRSCDG